MKPPLQRGLHRPVAADKGRRAGPKIGDCELVRLLPQLLRRLGVAGSLPVIGVHR